LIERLPAAPEDGDFGAVGLEFPRGCKTDPAVSTRYDCDLALQPHLESPT
jgi:hypothetical protein